MNRRIYKIICLQILLSLLACNGGSRTAMPVVSSDLAPGRVVLEVSSNKQNWRYEVTPSTGAVVELGLNHLESGDSTSLTQKPSTGEANCSFQGSEAKSPDEKLIAQCSGEDPGISAEFRMMLVNANSATYRWNKTGRHIHGFVWSPNSRSLALLTSSQERGSGPLELLWAFAGHPVPHVTVYIEFIGADGTSLGEYLIRSDILYGRARILNWNR